MNKYCFWLPLVGSYGFSINSYPNTKFIYAKLLSSLTLIIVLHVFFFTHFNFGEKLMIGVIMVNVSIIIQVKKFSGGEDQLVKKSNLPEIENTLWLVVLTTHKILLVSTIFSFIILTFLQF